MPDPVLAKRFVNFPALTFWYGISPLDLLAMPNWMTKIYEDRLDSLLAQRQMFAMEAASVPYFSEDDRAKVLAIYEDQAQGLGKYENKVEDAPEVMSPGMAAMSAASMGIGYHFVDAEGKPALPEEVTSDA